MDHPRHATIRIDRATPIGASTDAARACPARVFVAIVAITLACVAGAQDGTVRAGDGRVVLTPVEAGVRDASLLSAGGRALPVDLRVPSAFDRVFRVSSSSLGAPPWRTDRPRGPELFARVAGGVIAVFPRSEYADATIGRVGIVPAGTVFHLGDAGSLGGTRWPDAPGPSRRESPAWARRAGAPPGQRVDSRVDLRARGVPASPSGTASLWTDESMRHALIGRVGASPAK